jgi:hypothetical protein
MNVEIGNEADRLISGNTYIESFLQCVLQTIPFLGIYSSNFWYCSLQCRDRSYFVCTKIGKTRAGNTTLRFRITKWRYWRIFLNNNIPLFFLPCTNNPANAPIIQIYFYNISKISHFPVLFAKMPDIFIMKHIRERCK